MQVLEPTLSQSYILGENVEKFSTADAMHIVGVYVPPGTHYCWVERGIEPIIENSIHRENKRNKDNQADIGTYIDGSWMDGWMKDRFKNFYNVQIFQMCGCQTYQWTLIK